MTQLVGLIAKKRAGKDTFAGFLVANHGFVRYAFADPLKATLLDVDPIVMTYPAEIRLSTLVALRGWEAAKELSEVRRLLQAHGVAIRDHVDPDVWLHATMRPALAEDRPVVITDVRFPNEADAIEAAGGTLVRIHRPDLVSTDAHVSENALNDRLCSLHVRNDGSLSDLEESARRLAQSLSV